MVRWMYAMVDYEDVQYHSECEMPLVCRALSCLVLLMILDRTLFIACATVECHDILHVLQFRFSHPSIDLSNGFRHDNVFFTIHVSAETACYIAAARHRVGCAFWRTAFAGDGILNRARYFRFNDKRRWQLSQVEIKHSVYRCTYTACGISQS